MTVEITKVEKLTDDMVVVHEKIVPPRGKTIRSRMFVGMNDEGEWKVLMPYSRAMADTWVKWYGKNEK